MSARAVAVPCGDITLEARLHLPEKPATLGVVLCHPHPLYGGSMDNNVVYALVAALTARGIAALPFNFRGVGRSGGEYGQGIAERQDVLAALKFLAESKDAGVGKVGLAGYSFGGGVALAAASKRVDLAGLALVSPAAGSQPPVDQLTMPKLLVAGEEDQFVTPQRLRALAAVLPPPVETETYPSADHLWWGAETRMAERVARFFAEHER